MNSIAPRAIACRAWLLAFALALLTPLQVPRAAETGDLAALRAQALELVNAARREHGGAPLAFSETLNRIAQAHAEDMLARGYYAHASPEGEDARDRYIAEGGDRYELVAENIASCSPCAEVPRRTHVEQFQRQWMESPHHRANILSDGVTQFGFGIVAGDDGPLFAVQTFAGPGSAGGSAPAAAEAGTAPRLAAGGAGQAFAQALNARRQAQSRPPLEFSDALSATAAKVLPEQAGGDVTLGRDALAGQLGGDWATTSALVGSCGGCGAEITGADIGTFLDMWLQNPAYEQRLLGPGPTSVGFAMRAYGDGRKVAVAVFGQRR